MCKYNFFISFALAVHCFFWTVTVFNGLFVGSLCNSEYLV
ncbi:hypothetical protein HMPREF9441_01131 [Paraprevotella clara YIT 11840]|uniref:Uncharacterized protein n=1 Tax=Paraprevotella clara YIT 11840 TaxID=762968 RepID=G5SNW9_9BACT|nr:hypothetical protein HMPREF9441_01131 [Paraprevotella clara YIT 11840]